MVVRSATLMDSVHLLAVAVVVVVVVVAAVAVVSGGEWRWLVSGGEWWQRW
jgi:hypothetical protein